MLNVSHVSKTFSSGFLGSKKTKAVNDVSFKVEKGSIFGLVGGSGSGKTTLSRIIMGLLYPDAGSVELDGRNLLLLSRKEWKTVREDIQMVFQNPQKTFNPRFTVRQCCLEPLRLFSLCAPQDEEKTVCEMLDSVGVSHDQLDKYPHEISGGQAQRIAIARAIVLQPKLIICDEATSMLDVSIQAQIIDLLRHINKERGTTLLFISHDLEVVKYLADSVGIMNKGRLVESGKTKDVFSNPVDAFTKELFSAL